jgi:NADPH:quinone reductase-like Zn-dependent oxidoreductase
MTIMKAMRIHSYGGPEVLVYEDAPLPVVNEDDVLIRVHAAGVNPVDWKIREGYLQERMPLRFPFILGWDVAGTIEQTESKAAGFRPGDAVYSRPDISRNGGYAQYIAVRGNEVALKPENLDFEQAAAVPLAALTAWQSIFDLAHLQAGQKILVHAAAGGVGHFAVQFAKWCGAHVIGTASGRNQEFLTKLGAHEAIDYTAVPFEEKSREVDVVLDTLGGEVWERSWQVLKKGGIMVSTLHAPPESDYEAARDKRGAYVFVQPNAAQLGEIAELIDSGHVRPEIEHIYSLPEAAEAHRSNQQGHTRGKLVLRVAS